MSESQWEEFGSTLNRIHITELPLEILQHVRRETFIPAWSQVVRELHARVNEPEAGDPYRQELAVLWKENTETIQTLLERTEAIGKSLQAASLEYVLCHADIHTANILLTPEQNMFIVDWDDALLAPKERDLMFVLHDDTTHSRAEEMFLHGYGEADCNRLVLAYYRYEWCIQEIGDFGARIFLAKDTGDCTKQEALEGFRTLFLRGDVIDSALNTQVDFR